MTEPIRAVAALLPTLLLILLTATAAAAQAWVLPKGAGTVTFLHQRLFNTGHRRIGGFLAEVGQSTNMAFYVEGEYALTDRLSVAAGIPFVSSKLTATRPPPPPIPVFAWDACHCWQSSFQDFGITARYNLMNGTFAMTPSVSFGTPSHGYEYRGEAVVGRNLTEVRFALDLGRRLDAISPSLSVQGQYSYAVVERPIDDIPNNRSNARAQAAYAWAAKLSTYGFVSWQRTHGGLTFGSPVPGSPDPFPGEVNTPERLEQHDRMMRDNYWHVGGGASFGFEKFDVFGSYTEYVAGTDTHAGRGFTLGISFPFQLGGSR
ncbi:MAG TPA: hypothetical protein VFR18_06340 [Terriglobia bacterium]|nr:hypothetical protein [Terriglobia bacterium]